MNTMLTVVAMETVHHDYWPTFVPFKKKKKKSMFNNALHLIIYRAIFTKHCMSKVQYVGGKHMMSYKCVTLFRRKAAIL